MIDVKFQDSSKRRSLDQFVVLILLLLVCCDCPRMDRSDRGKEDKGEKKTARKERFLDQIRPRSHAARLSPIIESSNASSSPDGAISNASHDDDDDVSMFEVQELQACSNC
jgi:hypothetical protein